MGLDANDIGSFVDAVFINLFNRTADPEGKEYWSDEFSTRLLDGRGVGTAIIDIISGAQDTDAGKDISIVSNKIEVATFYGINFPSGQWSQSDDRQGAVMALDGIDESDSSVTEAQNSVLEIIMNDPNQEISSLGITLKSFESWTGISIYPDGTGAAYEISRDAVTALLKISPNTAFIADDMNIPGVNFVYGDDVSASFREDFEGAISDLLSEFSDRIPSVRLNMEPTAIIISSDVSFLAAFYADLQSITLKQAMDSLGNTPIFYGEYPNRTQAYWINTLSGQSLEDLKDIGAHEFFHIAQYGLMGDKVFFGVPDDQTPFAGPRWLIEGSASKIDSFLNDELQPDALL